MKAFLKKTFPYLSVAAAANGPIGSAGAKVLSTALGREIKAGQIKLELSNLALAGGEEGKKAHQAEQLFASAMRQLGFEKADDLDSVAASDREAIHPEPVKDMMPVVLSVFVNILFFLALVALMVREIPATSRDIILILMGALVTGWKDTYGYYLGSSAGSSKKDTTIANMTK